MSISSGKSPLRSLIRSEPLDHPPVLLWKHFRIDEPRELARRTVRFYRDHRLQLAAYAIALEEMGHWKAEQGMVVRF